MSPGPWQPPRLPHLLPLGLRLELASGALQADRVDWNPCYRIIASEYAGENLFERIIGDLDYRTAREEGARLREIADLTNPAALHEAGRVDLVPMAERVDGPGSRLIMTAFASPTGASRFSDGSYGYYAAAGSLRTAIAEARYHEERTLRGSGACVVEKTVVQADVDAMLLDVRSGHPCPDGVHDSFEYSAGQALGATVRTLDGPGIVHDSVRDRGGECVAIFRPSVLSNVTPVRTLRFFWDGGEVVEVR